MLICYMALLPRASLADTAHKMTLLPWTMHFGRITSLEQHNSLVFN